MSDPTDTFKITIKIDGREFSEDFDFEEVRRFSSDSNSENPEDELLDWIQACRDEVYTAYAPIKKEQEERAELAKLIAKYGAPK